MNKQFNKESIITSMEWIKDAVESAMEPQFKPVYKKQDTLRADISAIYDLELSAYEKLIINYLLVRGGDRSTTMGQIATACAISRSSAKRSITSLKADQIVINHPQQSGYCLNYKGII